MSQFFSDTIAQNDGNERPMPRGVIDENGRIWIGRVGAPPQQEATSRVFYFWVPPDALVETTQLVTCESEIGGRHYTFYAIVDEVHRCSRKRNMGHEVDEMDNDLAMEPPFDIEGYTYAQATILRVIPTVLTAPRERSKVYLAREEDARIAYRADEIENPLAIALVINGGSALAGPGEIDLDYLLGVNGGHLNVTGAAGRGTKSSFLLLMNWLLLKKARDQAKALPSSEDRLRVVPIILNVKNFDLFYIDKPSNRYNPEKHSGAWRALGIPDPVPFQNVRFLAPQQPDNELAIVTGRNEGVEPYSWGLHDIVREGLFRYLFAETDANDANFGALVLDLENWMTQERAERDGLLARTLREGRPTTFEALLEWVDAQIGAGNDGRAFGHHHDQTWRKLHRRLQKMLFECRGVLRWAEQQGHPLTLTRVDTIDPIVVDLSSLAREQAVQRFVVAAILRQLVDARTGANVVHGLVYLVTLDELNRFAPRGADDAITRLIETVASEMRSQGIILLGAQQQASKVSERVIDNSALRVLGKTGYLELTTPTWRFLSESARSKAANLALDEKLIIQDNFREPMHVRVPFPGWAMNPREARTHTTNANGSADETNVSDIIDE